MAAETLQRCASGRVGGVIEPVWRINCSCLFGRTGIELYMIELIEVSRGDIRRQVLRDRGLLKEVL